MSQPRTAASHGTAIAVFIACAGLGTAVDLLTKHLAVAYLSNKPLIIFKDVFSFHFVTNENMIWGLPLLPKSVAVLLPVIATPVIVFIFYKMKPYTVFNSVTFGLILAGTLGNLFDRLFFKNANGVSAVRDFISVDLIDWPVFNMADVFICIGAALLAAKILFSSRQPTPESPASANAQESEPPK